MPSKDPRVEPQPQNADVVVSLRRTERFLRILTWQMFFLLALLFYLAIKPQAGRYQFLVEGPDVWVFDTASWQAVAIKLQRQEVFPGRTAQPATPPGGEGRQ